MSSYVVDGWSIAVWKWAIDGVLYTRTITILSQKQEKTSVQLKTQPSRFGVEGGNGRSWVIYVHEVIKILRFPKESVLDQLFFELPCLMAFRSKEVTTWRAEWINFEQEETLVLDAKKKKLFTVSLSRTVAKHAEEVLDGRSEGLVIQSTSSAWRWGKDKPLSNVAVWYKWHKYTSQMDLWPSPKDYSPIIGRPFAALMYMKAHGRDYSAIPLLQRFLRHDRPETTWDYVARLYEPQDVKDGYDRFQNFVEKRMENFPLTTKVKV